MCPHKLNNPPIQKTINKFLKLFLFISLINFFFLFFLLLQFLDFLVITADDSNPLGEDDDSTGEEIGEFGVQLGKIGEAKDQNGSDKLSF